MAHHSAVTLPTHTAALFETAVQQAVDALSHGDIVALPTETVYGLAANALNDSAVAKIFALKGRPAHNPLIIHVAGLDLARACAANFSSTAERLARAFWPGPLTLVVPKASTIPPSVTAGGSTVALRWPSHPFIQAVIRRAGFPLAAPSANPSNQISPTNATHVQKFFGNQIDWIIDGGQCQVGIESTVVDTTVVPIAILRPGVIDHQRLREAAGVEVSVSPPIVGSLKSPGQLRTHYSPRAKVCVLHWNDENDLTRQLRDDCGISPESFARVHVLTHSNIPMNTFFGRVAVIPNDAEAFARAFYAELHRCDDEGADFIIVEEMPAGPGWDGVRDRLSRSASK